MLPPSDEDDDTVVYATVGEAIRAALGQARQFEDAAVSICRAERVGCVGRPLPCPDCYIVDPSDRRSYEEHLRAYFKGDG